MNDLITVSLIMKQDVGIVFDTWMDIERYPKFLNNIKHVQALDKYRSRWEIVAPLDIDVMWESEITTLEPKKRIAWNGSNSQLKVTGQVSFNELPNDQVQVTLLLKYAILNKEVGKIFSNLKDESEQKVRQCLLDFKKYVEAIRLQNSLKV